MAGTPLDLLERILAPDPPPFALLHRPDSGTPDCVDVLTGDVSLLRSLADLPLEPIGTGSGDDLLVVIPYHQIAERGFEAIDEADAPLITMAISEHHRVGIGELQAKIPDTRTVVRNGRFDCDDQQYADTVRRIVADEIGTGEGANFVIKRSYLADIDDYSPRRALTFFRRLLEQEHGAYWTFLVHTAERTLVGATPERHITLSGGTAVMNPISGTYRYPASGPTLQGVWTFLADPKETDELFMVLDEELKMMARICRTGGRISGPFLKEMACVAHTEYFIEGHTDRDVRDILKETMFAPTVTGSPLESATRVIRRYEPAGRGYYSGVAALIGRDATGERTLDSAILIRTADIDPYGGMRIGVGATLVRHSDPTAEVEETRAKAAGLLRALETPPTSGFSTHPDVRAALLRRNDGIAGFWQRDDSKNRGVVPELAGLRTLIVDAEDTFTAMIDHQLRSVGPCVTVCRFDQPYRLDDYEVVVMGPGPGDPRNCADPKIAHLGMAIDHLLSSGRPFVAVCLSHQVLCLRLGLSLERRAVCNQGVQRAIDLFGTRRRVGFYNTFAAYSSEDKLLVPGLGAVEISRDPDSGEVQALRGANFASMQFHTESVLTVDGPGILAEAVRGAIGR
jgi:2-amino-4-deoxychorismate synthase